MTTPRVRRRPAPAPRSAAGAVLLAALALAACTSGDDTPDGDASSAADATGEEASADASADATEGGGDGTTTASETSASDGASPTGSAGTGATGGTGDGAPGTATGGTGGAAAAPDLERLVEAQRTAVVRVVYTTTATGGGPSSVIWSQDPPRFRFEVGPAVTVFDGTRGVSCTDAETRQCVDLPADALESLTGTGLGLLGVDPGAAAGAGEVPPGAVTPAGSRAVAGRQADCLVIDAAAAGSPAGGTAEYCFDADTGFLLSADGADLDLVATEVGTPGAGDFVIP